MKRGNGSGVPERPTTTTLTIKSTYVDLVGRVVLLAHRKVDTVLLRPFLCLSLVALTAAAPAPEKASPFLGLWELDLSRMPATYGPAPKRVTYRFEAIGGAKWRTVVDVTAPDDSVRHMVVDHARDGSAAPGAADTSEADSAAFLSPTPDTLVMSLAKNRTLGSVRVYQVAADGRTMTETAASVNGDGAPFVRMFHYKRLR